MNDRDSWLHAGAEQVVPGVHRIPLPMPDDGLKAVNVYAISDGADLTMIDGGWAIEVAEDRLEESLASIGHGLEDIRRFLVTHVHRDHYELAITLRRRLGSRVSLGSLERPSLVSLCDQEVPDEVPILGRLQTCGAHDLIQELKVAARSQAGQEYIAWELPDRWLRNAEIIELATGDLEVVATPGHTQGHVVFVHRESGSLFAGDHILPHITPSIGFEQVPSESALIDYLASLALVRSLPDMRLLPAHGPVRPTTHDRIDELLVHHDERLDETFRAVTGGAETAFEVAGRLRWTRRRHAFEEMDPFNRMLAVNETAAHLDVLVFRDVLAVAIDGQGIRRYTD